jgi:hypothetical protein
VLEQLPGDGSITFKTYHDLSSFSQIKVLLAFRRLPHRGYEESVLTILILGNDIAMQKSIGFEIENENFGGANLR